jgi:hypothetical protein
MNELAECEWLCRSVAANELDGLPCYLVDASDLEGYERSLAVGDFLGWTSRYADLILCDYLTKRDKWRGRGFACVMRCDQLPTLQDLAGCVLHELAHFICHPAPKQISVDASILSEPLIRLAKTDLKLPAFPDNLPPWDGHEADFVRVACHVAHRSGLACESIRPRHLRFASAYYPRPFGEHEFMTALESELNDKRSIREIVAGDPPEAFSKLWHHATE